MDTGTKSYNIWFDELNRQSEATKLIYLRWMGYFLERWGIPDAEELYRMKREDLRSEDPRDTLRVEGMARTFMAEKMREGLKANTVKMLVKALKSFFSAQNTPFIIRPRDLPRGDTLGMRLILKDQIAACYDSVGSENRLRNRALVMIAKDSGLRISDVSLLNVGHYRDAALVKNGEGDPFRVFDPVETKKAKVNAHIHLGPEAILAVDAYLSSRGALSPDAPLIRGRYGGRVGMNALSMQFKRLTNHVNGAKKLGAHSFRKFHTTQLEAAGMPLNWIKKVQGKSLDASTGVYSKPEESGELTASYVKAYDKLRVFGVDDVRQLRRELETEKAKQDERVTEMEAKLEQMKKRLEEIYEREKPR